MVLQRLSHWGVYFFAISVWVCFLLPGIVHAQNTAGIGLKPATIEETVDPGVAKSYEIVVSNLKETEQTFYLFKRNISGVRNGGVPIFANEDREVTGYELVDWITLPETEIVVAPNADQRISFTMDVPEDASPGSHFGGIFISAEPPRLRSSGAGVGYEVANIVSIRVSGDAVEKAMLRSFRTDNYVYSEPNVTFTANIRNDGNVLVRPTGPLEIMNMFGKEVATLTFNETEAGVFPKTDREFEITWEDEGTGFGRYEAIVSPVFGDAGAKQTISSSVTFWILPMDIILPAAIGLLILLASIYFGVKLYVRRTVMQMTGGRKLVRAGGRRRAKQQSSPVMLILVVTLTVTALYLILLLVLFA